MSQDHRDTFSSRWTISPLTGTRFMLRTWQSSRRPSSLANERASATVRVTMPVELSFKTSLYGFHIHQAKSVQERLSPIVIPRRRQSYKKSETTDCECNCVRWDSINWVQRKSRPDVSALASLGMGSLNCSTVQDLYDANVTVERLKAEPFLGVKLPHIPIHHVRWATVSRCFLGKCC